MKKRECYITKKMLQEKTQRMYTVIYVNVILVTARIYTGVLADEF